MVSLQPGVLHCATLSLQHHYSVGKRYHITMPLQSQNVIGLYRDVNPTKTGVARIPRAQYGRFIELQLVLLINYNLF